MIKEPRVKGHRDSRMTRWLRACARLWINVRNPPPSKPDDVVDIEMLQRIDPNGRLMMNGRPVVMRNGIIYEEDK